MASIRSLLGIFSREVSARVNAPLHGEDLVAFARAVNDPHQLDQALQQAGRAPFWPQDARMTRFYRAAMSDRALANRLKAAAELSMGARRHALAHLHMAPDPASEALLPQRHHAHVHMIAADPQDPAQSRSFMRRLRRPHVTRLMGTARHNDTLAPFGGDISGLLATGIMPEDAVRHVLRAQVVGLLQAGLRAAFDGVLPARLDAQLGLLRDAADRTAAVSNLQRDLAVMPQRDARVRSQCMEAVDAVGAVLAYVDAAPLEFLFTCRDDRQLMQRGFGDRLRVDSYSLTLDKDTAAHFESLGALIDDESRIVAAADDSETTAGLDIVTAASAPADLALCSQPQDALTALSLFARGISRTEGNRGLRQYWQRHEESGVTSRIGSHMGLVLADLQQLYEELTRRDVHQTTPDIRRLQDRMFVRALSPMPAATADTNDSA